MSGAPEESDDSSRRRLLALLAAALLALLGAGTGVTNLFGGGDDDEAGGVDLSVDYSVTPDERTARPTPTPTPTPTGGGGSSPDGTAAPPEPPDTTTGIEGQAGGSTTPDTSRRVDDPDDEPRPNVETVTETAAPGSDLATTSIPPVSVTDVEPGDGGTVDLSLTLSGSPAHLWISGAATDFAERGVVEAERSAGDTGEPGELQQYVQVRLWYDADGDGSVGDGDNLVYEGTLADLDGLGDRDGWASLTGGCVPPGTHTARFRWDLPSDAPNDVQTDGVSFSLSIAADTSACE